ncbi:UNVERIFIED_CONTAM: hypothetical protein GTU68_036868 [Idotea baltica]|nr:hypothetical protein [Idotea baltica]
MKVVSSCNIACGGHAGDEAVMRTTVRAALKKGVSIGAHPSFPDRENFGRIVMDIDPVKLTTSLLKQVRHLKQIANDEGAIVRHLKPHGALYNEAAKDKSLAQLISNIALDAGIHMLFGPPKSELERSALSAGLAFVAEGFADRAYERDGSLAGRNKTGAVISDAAEQSARSVQMVLQQTVEALDGSTLPMSVKTICLHGDGARAAESARTISTLLTDSGVEITALQTG